MATVCIIGVGPGHERWLSLAAKEAIHRAALVVATPRLAQNLGHLHPYMVGIGLSEIKQTVVKAAKEHDCIAVLVSGDVGFFSASTGLGEALSQYPHINVRHINGVSSLQYLCAQVGVPYEGVKAVSLHGREGSLVPFVTYNPLVFALSGGAIKAHTIVRELVDSGLGEVLVSVGENLSDSTERILTGTAESLVAESFDDLTCVLVRNDRPANPHLVLEDKDFIRGSVPMTKQAVRSVVLSTLNIQPDDVVWDIGAGTGSVAIAMAGRAYRNFVFGVEKKKEAVLLLLENRLRHRAYNMVVVEGEAPACLHSLPAPDKVFIGGSSGNLGEIVGVAVGANPMVKVVVTAISLETLSEAMKLFESMGFDAEAVCINTAISEQVGAYHLMKAQNPVYIITGFQRAITQV